MMANNTSARMTSGDANASNTLRNGQWEEFNADSVLNNGTNNNSRGAEAVVRRTTDQKTVREVQQELAENCGLRGEIIWDLLTSNDAQILKTKIEHLMPYQNNGKKRIDELRNTLFENVWAQRKYTNGTSVSSIFYVMVTNAMSCRTVLDSKKFSFHPVFRCKKCDSRSNTRNCCMIFIDETGRVYQNWNSFLKENVFPPGKMITPPNGIYDFDANNKVILNVYSTPSGTPEAQLLNVAQTTSTVAGFGAACVPLVALVAPIAAPLIPAAGVIGLGVGAFTAITSALNLSDRKNHDQSISITNKQARASYLGVIGGSVGIAAAGATRLVSSMAAAGKATASIEVLLNGINVSSIVLSGSGVATGVLDLVLKVNDGDKITKLGMLQLSSSLVLFTHSVYNFKLASRIANDARSNSIILYRETLSNRQRKMFDKISKETLRIKGAIQGKIDIVRGINEIPGRQYLNDLFKINNQLKQNNVKPAFGRSGKNIILNNDLPVDTSVLRQSVQHQKGPNILEQVSKRIPSTYTSSSSETTSNPNKARLLCSSKNVERSIVTNHDPLQNRGNNNVISILRNLAVVLPNDVIILLKECGTNFMNNVADGQQFEDVILSMAENLTERTFRYLIQLAQTFIDSFLAEILQQLRIFIPTESVLYRIVKYVLENYRDLSYEYISQRGTEILRAIKNYFLTLNPNNPTISKKCPDCHGMFHIRELS